MIVSFKRLSGWFVFEKKSLKDPVATMKDCGVDSDTGKIFAYWVFGIAGLQVLRPADIWSWIGGKVVVEDETVFQDPQKLPRLADLFEREVAILGAPVWQAGKKLGTVKDFFFDTETQFILSFVYKKYWFSAKKTVFRYQVIRITEAGLEVDLTRTKKEAFMSESNLFAASMPPVQELKEITDL
ncbi:hypothetical protein CSB37_00275 [bacterium DOLZORAL124_38_8]|nr:MAG: hypothetical protein CSB37_00275 [bacterium DOLZORAL124_38_8]